MVRCLLFRRYVTIEIGDSDLLYRERVINMANVQRDEKGRFLKGSVPNPSGRPKTDETIRALFQPLVPKTIELIRNLLQDETAKPEHRLRAAEIVLNRVYGREPINIEESARTVIVQFESGEDYGA